MRRAMRWWTETATRFPELVLLGLGDHWRFGAVQGDGEDASPVGPYYATKAEALADLDRYARFYGCKGA